jgi:hypothetical protein
MRKKLKDINNHRKTFIGVFKRYGTRDGYKDNPPVKTILLTDIKTDGELVTNHIWFTLTKGFKQLGELEEGTIIMFDARVKPYTKGYRGHRIDVYQDRSPVHQDYKLNNPTNIRLLSDVITAGGVQTQLPTN